MFVNGRRVDEKGDFVSFDTRRASMFILLCNAVQGRRGSDRSPSFLPFPAVGERAIASGQGTRLRRQEGVRKCRISPQDSWHAAEYVGIASHGLRPFPIRATLFVVAEKLPVHLTSSCSFAVARGAWIKTPLSWWFPSADSQSKGSDETSGFDPGLATRHALLSRSRQA